MKRKQVPFGGSRSERGGEKNEVKAVTVDGVEMAENQSYSRWKKIERKKKGGKRLGMLEASSPPKRRRNAKSGNKQLHPGAKNCHWAASGREKTPCKKEMFR